MFREHEQQPKGWKVVTKAPPIPQRLSSMTSTEARRPVSLLSFLQATGNFASSVQQCIDPPVTNFDQARPCRARGGAGVKGALHLLLTMTSIRRRSQLFDLLEGNECCHVIASAQ